MATVEELVQQYKTDTALQNEVAAILADGKVSISEFMAFAKKHNSTGPVFLRFSVLFRCC